MNLIKVEQEAFADGFNRLPFGLRHNLHALPLFSMGNLRHITSSWGEKDSFVAKGAPAAGTVFYDTAPVSLKPGDAFARLGDDSYRILLKRLERNTDGFRELLDGVFEEVCCLRPSLRNERVVRLESFLFISSASTITPFHFDPEMNFFFQIIGDKVYHLYPPSVLEEEELERYYLRGAIDIGQVDFERRRNQDEHCFELKPGLGLHQPINAPHWVETASGLSVSYSFSIETERTRSLGHTRAFNSLVRRAGAHPRLPGFNEVSDRVKARAMQLTSPLLRSALAVRRMASRNP